ncbi:cupin domain-containing protein [Mycolicibacterium arenosum]|uniref:Cupin domain-containing protein n=1 Tax=Mycolicibacterium arenosum TaxID=2952157 RepID=A0ABT1LUP6_9MYCO|nr:cupin domain-containing protein [Mycolicibacterium sp. CAU 1645]MCP9270626.1 cupin domain-containing protein [Mycolicibacterium sp. CAU 1645]
MTTQSPAFVVRDAGAKFHFLNTLYTAKVNSEQTNGQFTAMEFLAPRNFGPPLHRHDAEDELFYIVDGELWLCCGDVEAIHGAGAVVWLPRGLPHTFQVRSETAKVFQLSTPGGFEHFVTALGEPTDKPGLPAPGPIDPGHVAEVCGQFDIQVLGPPPAPR